jgi:hypothetical protein
MVVGGHVYLVGNKGLWTLFHLKFVTSKQVMVEMVMETEVLVLMEMINS